MSINREQIVSERVMFALQELHEPIWAVVCACELLERESASKTFPAITRITKVAGTLNEQVRYLYLNVEKEFDISSPTKALLQLQQHIFRWNKQKSILLKDQQEILKLRELGIKLANSELDAVLDTTLIISISKFDDILNLLTTFEEKHLVPTKANDDPKA